MELRSPRNTCHIASKNRQALHQFPPLCTVKTSVHRRTLGVRKGKCRDA